MLFVGDSCYYYLCVCWGEVLRGFLFFFCFFLLLSLFIYQRCLGELESSLFKFKYFYISEELKFYF